MRSDNGGEFVNSDISNLLKQKGITHQTTVAYTPQQNGRAEREMRTIVEAARTMLQAKKLQKDLWAEAVSTAVFTINRTGKSKVPGKTPYELLYNKSFNIQSLRTFGEEVYIHIPKERRQKWDAKSKKGIFVGYGIDTKGYRIWIEKTKVVNTYRDVIFIQGETEKSRVVYFDYEENKDDKIIHRTEEGEIPDVMIYNRGETERKFQKEEEQTRTETYLQGNTEAETESLECKQLGRETPSHGKNSKEQRTEEDYESCEEFDEENRDLQRTRTRVVKLPKKFKDYYTGFNACAEEQLTYEKAMKADDSYKWIEAIERELTALEVNNTWIEIEPPKDKKILDTKWVFKVKKGEKNDDIYKARLVARGFQQEDDFDHSEIYTPVAKLPTLRILLAIASRHNLNLSQMDVKSAFLYGDIEEDVYLRLPKGVEKYEGKVLKLQKSLYGLKKSPRNWNNKFNNFMEEEGFIRSKADYCMYYKQKKRFYLLLYVDDLIIISEKQEDIDKLKEALQRNFQMTDQGSNKMRYLGINITVKDKQLELDQRQYLEGLLNKYGMNDCNPSATPVETGLLLSSEPATDSNMVKRCRQLVGSLMYAMLGTRPDLCFAISYLSRYQVYADENLWKALKRVLRYIKGTLDYKLIYKNGEGETDRIHRCRLGWR